MLLGHADIIDGLALSGAYPRQGRAIEIDIVNKRSVISHPPDYWLCDLL